MWKIFLFTKLAAIFYENGKFLKNPKAPDDVNTKAFVK